MQRFTRLAMLVVMFILIAQLPLLVCAENTRLDSQSVTEEVKRSFLDITDLTLLTEEGYPQPIACFNVSNDGLIALGFENFAKKTVLVYSTDGTFQYGFRFSCDGSFGVSFVGENLSIYFAKSRYLATFNSNGTCTAIESVKATSANSETIRKLLYSTQYKIGDLTYHLERDIGFAARSYSRLIVSDSHGFERIIYNVSLIHNIQTVFAVIAGCCIVILVPIQLKKQMREKSDSKKQEK